MAKTKKPKRRAKSKPRAPRPKTDKQLAYETWALSQGGFWRFGRLWVKQGDYYVYRRRLQYHKFVYRANGGYSQRGWHIHHCDVDPSNNSFSNLIALPRDLHTHIHVLIRARGDIPFTKAECQSLLNSVLDRSYVVPLTGGKKKKTAVRKANGLRKDNTVQDNDSSAVLDGGLAKS